MLAFVLAVASWAGLYVFVFSVIGKVDAELAGNPTSGVVSGGENSPPHRTRDGQLGSVPATAEARLRNDAPRDVKPVVLEVDERTPRGRCSASDTDRTAMGLCDRLLVGHSVRPVGVRARPTDHYQDSPQGTSAGRFGSDQARAPTLTLTASSLELVDRQRLVLILVAGRRRPRPARRSDRCCWAAMSRPPPPLEVSCERSLGGFPTVGHSTHASAPSCTLSGWSTSTDG